MWLVWILCTIAAFADVIGGAITVLRRLTYKQVLFVTGLGAGFLLGATILDRLPDSMSAMPKTAAIFIVVGYLLMYLLNQFGAGHNHAVGLDEYHEHAATNVTDAEPLDSDATVHNVTLRHETIHNDTGHSDTIRHNHREALVSSKSAYISFLGLLLHTFMDGVIVAGAFSINRATGILIFFAIALHKLPEGFSMATLTLAAGESRKRAFLTSVGLAVSTMVGAAVTLGLGAINTTVINILMAIATGTFLYVSTSDLIPALGGRHRLTIPAVFIGVTVFEISLLCIKHFGLT